MSKKKQKKEKEASEKGYDTGRHGMTFWTTSYELFEAMKKFILKD